jgi:hypothetical protein
MNLSKFACLGTGTVVEPTTSAAPSDATTTTTASTGPTHTS